MFAMLTAVACFVSASGASTSKAAPRAAGAFASSPFAARTSAAGSFAAKAFMAKPTPTTKPHAGKAHTARPKKAVVRRSPAAEAVPASTPSTIYVRSREKFTDTGIALHAGDSVSIRGTGRIHFGTGTIARVAPTGIAWGSTCRSLSRAHTAPWPAPGLPCWSLIGRIGSGKAFEIGADRSFQAGVAGELFLGVNDNYTGDNSGWWAAPIAVSRASTGSVSPSGQPMPVGDLPGWHQVFADDFTTSFPVGAFSGCSANNSILRSHCSGLPASVDAKWTAYPDGWSDTSGNGRYEPSQVISVANGMMDLHLHTANGIHMVSAPVPKIPGATGSEGGLLYGRFSARFRADAVPGYKTAWLLWPDSENWPGDGEIDYPEGDLDSTFSAYMHRQDGRSGSDQDAYDTGAAFTSWHTVTIQWSPSSCSFILDGRVIGTSTSRVPDTAMHWVLQTETAGDQQPSSSAAGDVQIDWVTVYVPSG